MNCGPCTQSSEIEEHSCHDGPEKKREGNFGRKKEALFKKRMKILLGGRSVSISCHAHRLAQIMVLN